MQPQHFQIVYHCGVVLVAIELPCPLVATRTTLYRETIHFHYYQEFLLCRVKST